jgi:hypothetical protein
MTFPITPKPKSIDLPGRLGNVDYSKAIFEVPNLVSPELAQELKAFASDSESSGLHRRGSKNSFTSASFYTCLVFRYDNPIYETLNHVWVDYGKNVEPDIAFIEPYEIKMYVEGDKFDSHHDFCGDPTTSMCRKLNLIIQLSDESDYDGGELLIGPHKLSRKIGTGIFFPADVYHTVTTITRGSRFSLIGHGWGPYNKQP